MSEPPSRRDRTSCAVGKSFPPSASSWVVRSPWLAAVDQSPSFGARRFYFEIGQTDDWATRREQRVYVARSLDRKIRAARLRYCSYDSIQQQSEISKESYKSSRSELVIEHTTQLKSRIRRERKKSCSINPVCFRRIVSKRERHDPI
jgi:hypothetical protein